ncbi:STAS domain-containing protein [Kitasatospora sp. NPDC058263]
MNRAIVVQPAPLTLVVDLGAVTFTDSAGLNMLLARTEADRRGIAVRLARPSRSAARALEITGCGPGVTVRRGRGRPRLLEVCRVLLAQASPDGVA